MTRATTKGQSYSTDRCGDVAGESTSAGATSTGATASPDDELELARLRAEVDQLRAELREHKSRRLTDPDDLV